MAMMDYQKGYQALKPAWMKGMEAGVATTFYGHGARGTQKQVE